jgi:hypothetical protein
MVGQNVFPKADGDILFGSEVSRFFTAGQFIAAGSFGILNSGTATQNFGSIVIPAGSLSNPCDLFLNFHTITTTPGNSGIWFITVSGLSSNATINLGNASPTRAHPDGIINMRLGSPGSGALISLHSIGAGTNDRQAFSSNAFLPSLHTGSAVVIQVSGVTASNSTAFHYHLQNLVSRINS